MQKRRHWQLRRGSSDLRLKLYLFVSVASVLFDTIFMMKEKAYETVIDSENLCVDHQDPARLWPHYIQRLDHILER